MIPLLKRATTLSIIVAQLLSPMLYAEGLEADSGNTRYAPGIEMAPNQKVPVVTIMAPNGGGLSHNKYINYNVTSDGLILNNSNKATVNTQLAGYIYGNKNLTNKDAAKVILNEVTSRQKTELRGYTEVAGEKASVIVANPNGVYINGAGFINTKHATITTGMPIINHDTGELNNFRVDSGSIDIEGEGFNASSVDKASLYSETLNLNGKLYASELDVISGNNMITADGTSYTALQPTEPNSMYSIDSTVLGGIYAQKIRLIATKEGIGVNLPIEVTSSSDLYINAKGKIQLGTTIASNNVFVTSDNDGIASHNMYAKNIDLSAHTTIMNQNIMASEDAMVLRSDNLINENVIAVGVDRALNRSNTTASLEIKADSSLLQEGNMYSSKDMVIQTKALTNNGLLEAENALRIESGDTILRNRVQADSIRLQTTNLIAADAEIHSNTLTDIQATGDTDLTQASLQSQGSISLQTHALNVVESEIISNGDVTIRATNELNNQEDRRSIFTDSNVIGHDVTLQDKNTDINIASANTIEATENLVINSHTLTNNGQIIANNNMEIQSDSLTNTHLIAANKILTIETDSFKNQGAMAKSADLVAQMIEITSKNLDMDYAHIGTTGNLEISSDSHFGLSNSSIDAGEAIHLISKEMILDKSDIVSDKEIVLTNTDIVSADTIVYSNTAIRLDTADRTNLTHASLQSTGNITVNTDTLQVESSELLSNSDITINASNTKTLSGQSVFEATTLKGENITIDDINSHLSINDSHTLEATHNITLHTNSMSNGGRIIADNDMSIRAETLSNSNLITSGKNLSITTAQRVDNSGKDTENKAVIASDKVDIHTKVINNSYADISASGSLDMIAENELNIQNGTLKSGGRQTIAAHNIILSDNAEMMSNQNIALSSTNFTGTDAMLYAKADIDMNTRNTYLTKTSLQSMGTIEVKTDTLNMGLSQILSNNALSLYGTDTVQIDQSDLQSIQSEIRVTADQAFINDSLLQANQNFLITDAEVVANNSEIYALHGNIGILDSKDIHVSQSIVAGYKSIDLVSKNTIHIDGSTLYNVDGSYDIHLKASNAVQGENSVVNSAKGVTLQSDNHQNIDLSSASISSQGGVTITGGDVTTANALLNSAEILTIRAENIDNRNGDIRSNFGMDISAKEVDNTDAIMLSNDDLRIVADKLTNTRGTIQSEDSIEVKTHGFVAQNGTLQASNTIEVQTDTMDVDSSDFYALKEGLSIVSNDAMSIRGNSTVAAAKAIRLSGYDLTLDSASIYNLTDNADISLYAGGDLHADQTRISSAGNLDVDIENKAVLTNLKSYSQNTTTIKAEEIHATDADIRAQKGIGLMSNSDITDTDGVHLSSADTITMETSGQSIALKNAQLSSNGDITFKTASLALEHTDVTTIMDGSRINIDNTKNLSISNHSTLITDHLAMEQEHHDDSSIVIREESSVKANAPTSNIILKANDVTVDHASIETQGTVTLASTDLYDVRDSKLLANGGLYLESANDFTHDTQELLSDSLISIKARSFTNDAPLLSNADMTIFATEGTVHNHNLLSAMDTLNIYAQDDVTNSGAIASGAHMMITATNLTNYNTLYSGGDMNLYVADTVLNKTDSVYAPGLDYARMYAVGDMSIAKNANQDKTQQITNDSAIIETQYGDIDIWAKLLENTKTLPDIYQSDKVLQSETILKRIYTYSDYFGSDTSAKSYISSGNDLNLHVDTLKNELSTIQASDTIIFNNTAIVNTDLTLYDYTQSEERTTWTTSDTYWGICHSGGFISVAHPCEKTKNTTHYSDWILKDPALTYKDSKQGVITANNIVGTTQSIVNGTFEPIGIVVSQSSHPATADTVYTRVDTSLTTDTKKDAIDATQAEKTIHTSSLALDKNAATITAQVISTDVKTSAVSTEINHPSSSKEIAQATPPNIGHIGTVYTVPTNPYGMFIATDPNKNPAYLIESNPAYTNINTFIDSRYFYEKMGLDTNAIAKRLGDAAYETKLISDAITALTGRRHISEGVSSDNDQYRVLMDNALNVSGILGLEIGKAPSTEQLANLSEDIVWMEYKEVAGENVLVPVVYLMKDYLSLKGASIIAGNSIDLHSNGDISNSGTIASGDTLGLSGSSITNNGGVIFSNGKAVLVSDHDFINKNGGIIQGGGDVQISSTQGSILNETALKSTTVQQGSGDYTATMVGARSLITSTGGNVTLDAQKDIKNLGADLSAGKNLLLISKEGDVDFKAIETKEGYNVYTKGGYVKTLDVDHISSTATAGETLLIRSGKDITLEAADLKAGGAVSLDATRNVALTSVNDSSYRDVQSTSKGFMSKKSTRDMSYDESVQATSINAENILTHSGGDTTLQAADLKATDSIIVEATGDVNVLAASYREATLHKTSKSSLGGLSKSSSLDSTDALNLHEANLKTDAKNIVLQSNKDLTIIAGNIESAADVQLKAFENLLITAGEELKSEKHEKQNSSLNIANLVNNISSAGLVDTGAVYSSETHKKNNYDTTAKSSTIQAGGSITADTGTTTLIGSNLDAGKDVAITADIGGINILTSQELTNASSLDKKTEIKLTNLREMIQGEIDRTKDSLSTDGSNTKLKFKIASGTFDESEVKSSGVHNVSSAITSHEGSVKLDSSDDLTITGSNIAAKDTIALKSTIGNITIQEATDSQNIGSKAKHASAQISATVQNEYVEIGSAIKAAVESAEQLKKVKEDYQTYKRSVKELEASQNALKQQYRDKVAGIDYSDIEDLGEVISTAKEDQKYYVAAIAAATADLATKTAAIATQTLTAAASSGTWGFSAGMQLDMKGSKTTASDTNTQSLASNLDAKNINIQTDVNTPTTTTISGSNVVASDTLNITTHDLDVHASTDTTTSKSNTKDLSGSVSVTMYGGGGASGSVGYGEQHATAESETNHNSNLLANTMNINVANDAAFKGATVRADEILNLTVGNNLNVESVRDSYSSNSNGFNVSGGISTSSNAKTSSNGANASLGTNTGSTLNKQTVLTSLTGDNVNITVGEETHLKGSLVAAGSTDENGVFQDNNNLNLSTKTLTFENSTNTNYSSSNSMSAGAVYSDTLNKEKNTNKEGVSSVSTSFSTGMNYERTKTLATLGNGNINITDKENSDDTDRLNRDTTKVDKSLIKTSMGTKVDASLDTRLLTEEGRAEIEQEYKDMDKNMKTIAETLPDANSDNKVEAIAGIIWDNITGFTGGILPSHANSGGVLGELPVLSGNKDSVHEVLQVVNTQAPLYQEGKENFIPLEQSDAYKMLPEEKQALYKDKNLYISKEPVAATYQNGTNGIMNNKGLAVHNVMEQTGMLNQLASSPDTPVEVTMSYNPTRGMVADLLESAVDTLGGTTGIAKQTGEFVRNVTTARGVDGSNFTMHSQGNLITHNGIEYINSSENTADKFQPTSYFATGEVDKDGRAITKVPTFVSFGSPVSGKEMGELIVNKETGLGYTYKGAFTKPGDFVGEGLGGNSGVNGQASFIDRINLINVGRLFGGDSSPHSSYNPANYEELNSVTGYKK